MDEHNEPLRESTDAEARHETMKEWETPELVVEDVARVTQGGFGNPEPVNGDDIYYTS